LSGKYTYKEMSRITGFSVRKIKVYAKRFVVASRMKPRGNYAGTN
jgi:DNA-binding transcriptional MerR regulator